MIIHTFDDSNSRRFKIPPDYTLNDFGIDGTSRGFLDPNAFNITSNLFNEGINAIIKIIINKLDKISFLLSSRGTIPFNNKTEGIAEYVQKEGANIHRVLARIFGSSKHRHICEKISKWAEKFGIAELNAGWNIGSTLSSDYRDKVFLENFNTAYAGFGSKQALVMLTELFSSKSGSTIMIEEPEISLHPENIIQLPYLFADAIKENKNIVITTHNHLLILALSKPIFDGLINKDDVTIYYTDKKPTGTHLHLLELSKEGYVKGGIPTFTDVERKLLNQFFETVKEE